MAVYNGGFFWGGVVDVGWRRIPHLATPFPGVVNCPVSAQSARHQLGVLGAAGGSHVRPLGLGYLVGSVFSFWGRGREGAGAGLPHFALRGGCCKARARRGDRFGLDLGCSPGTAGAASAPSSAERGRAKGRGKRRGERKGGTEGAGRKGRRERGPGAPRPGTAHLDNEAPHAPRARVHEHAPPLQRHARRERLPRGERGERRRRGGLEGRALGDADEAGGGGGHKLGVGAVLARGEVLGRGEGSVWFPGFRFGSSAFAWT